MIYRKRQKRDIERLSKLTSGRVPFDDRLARKNVATSSSQADVLTKE